MNLYGAERIPFAFLIDFLSEAPEILPLEECAAHQLFFITPGMKITPGLQPPLPDVSIFYPKTTEIKLYNKSFEIVRKNLLAGNSYLTNLTISTRVVTNYTFPSLFGRLKSRYQVLYKNNFICFSPETFITINNDLIRSFPMKGTIDAGIPDAEKQLRANPKEIAEHNTITDLIRNDLNMVSQRVSVTRPRYIDVVEAKGRKLLQMSSEITGHLPKGWQAQLGDIIYSMLPAGSISGAPKEKTVEIILQAEPHKRGYYTGIFGVYDGKSVDSCVLIRYMERSAKGFIHYKSGGGITAKSNPQNEFTELNQKIYVPLV